jgi:hypothetical protein
MNTDYNLSQINNALKNIQSELSSMDISLSGIEHSIESLSDNLEKTNESLDKIQKSIILVNTPVTLRQKQKRAFELAESIDFIAKRIVSLTDEEKTIKYRNTLTELISELQELEFHGCIVL